MQKRWEGGGACVLLHMVYIVIEGRQATPLTDFKQKNIIGAPLQRNTRLILLKVGFSTVGHLVDDVLPVLRLPAVV